jgi:shikimate kinase
MKRVYLIGLPGSGKSTSGKRFAKQLGWAYADLDKLVSIRAGRTIPAIFQKEGELAFRKYEQAALHETAASTHIVVGCGGGTAAFEDNISWMRDHGVVIWMNISLVELGKRLLKSVNERPMFPYRDPASIQQQLQKLFESRQHYYQQAHIQVDSEAALLRINNLVITSY